MKFLEDARRQQWKICSYGLGEMGKGTGKRLLEWLEVEPDYYCDQNSDVVDKYPVENSKKIYIDELLHLKDETLVFVFMGTEYSETAKKNLQQNNHLHVLTWKELIREDELIKKYFGIGDIVCYQKDVNIIYEKIERKIRKNDKIAIYTCITDNYDQLNEPLYRDDNCDYFFITDDKGKLQMSESSVYQLIDIEKIVPKEIESPKDKNRYCKSHGYEIFNNYDYSVYLDGDIRVINSILPLLRKIESVGLAFHAHPSAEDVYEEAMSLSLRTRITKEEASDTIRQFWIKGMPRYYGMVECGVILCDNRNVKARQLLNRWFENYNRGAAKRDQMYMAFSLWEMGIAVDEIQTLPGNLRTNGYFQMTAKHVGYQR